MRKSLACLAALAALILSVGIGIQPARALPVADLSSTTDGSPETVSPVGGVVYYAITFTNIGATVPAQLRNISTGGGTFDEKLSSIPLTCTAPADGTVDPAVVCDQLAFAGSVSLEVAIRTVSEGEITSTSTAAIDPSALGTVVEDDTTNNDSSVITPVANNSELSEALVGLGESLLYKTHTVTNTTGTNGIVISLSDALPEGDVCGDTLCGTGLHLGFGDPLSNRQGDVFIEARFQTDPCRGKGTGKCTTIYERKEDGVVTAVPPCSLLIDPKATCLDRIEKDGRALVHFVKMWSLDPDLLPPGTVTLS